MKSNSRSHYCLLALLLSTLAFCACSRSENKTAAGGKEPRKLELLLDWQNEPTYLGVYYARHLGLFKAAGADVEIIQSWGASAAVASVAAGKYQIATASGGATVLGYDNTQSIVSLGVIYPKIPTVIYGLAATNLNRPSDLRGKKVGIYPGSVTVNEFKAFLEANGLSESDMNVQSISGADIPLLKNRQVDAVLHYWEMSPVAVDVDATFPAVDGHRVSELRLSEYGVKGYGLNVVANKAAFQKDRVFLTAVANAIFEGYRRACEDPDAAVAAFIKEFPQKDPVYVKKSFSRVVQLVSRNYGTQTSGGWEETIDVYKKLGLLKTSVGSKDLMP